MLEILSNALLQGLTFGVAGIGVVMAFRVIRYPDLTADGSFMLGSAVFAASLGAGSHWLAAVPLAVLAGAAAGIVTATLNAKLGVSRLLSGILTTMICYAIAFRFLGGHPNRGLPAAETMFAAPAGIEWSGYALIVAGLFAAIAALAVWRLLGSDLGLLLRATGNNAHLVADLGRSPAVYRAVGLAVANGLVALSSALVSAQQGFVDINLGVGVVVTLIAALVLGEEAVRRLPRLRLAKLAGRAVAPLVGATIYFLLYLLILRASLRGWLPIPVEPTDLKLLSAVLVILVIATRRSRDGGGDLLPL